MGTAYSLYRVSFLKFNEEYGHDHKGNVKLIQLAYVVLHKEFFKPTSKTGKIGRFNQSLPTESVQVTLKFHLFILSNIKSTCRIFFHF